MVNLETVAKEPIKEYLNFQFWKKEDGLNQGVFSRQVEDMMQEGLNASIGVINAGDRMAKMMAKRANGVRKMGPNGKDKGVPIGHRPKVGLKILKLINSNGETSGLSQKKFDDGSSMAHDKVDKILNHLNAKNHQAIQFGGIEQSVVSSCKELMGMTV
ncbi:hypothetical protein J1N35_019015, partial [Gossypium stocksii]